MGKPSIILFLIIIILTTTPPSHSASNQTDFEALLAFKRSIDNDPLGALSSWNETTHFCRWNGVSCSKRHQNRVVSVSLISQGLVGTLPPHIGNLSFLRNIDLQNNTFRGPIPEEIGRLTRLQAIDFSNNSFVGGIPTNLSQCRNLYELNLIDNNLTGPIIPELASLVKLERLGLGTNMLSGRIPPFLGNLTNLILLSLVRCGMQGEIPESLVQLRRLQRLLLLGNSLTGTIPIGLFNLSSITHLAFGTNQLYGNIPSFTLPNLRYLDLGENRFTGVLPASLSNSSLIEHVRVASNNFTGEMIDLSRLPALVNLVTTSNPLKGDIHTILSSLSNSTSLTFLALADNLFTGSLPDSIGNLSTQLLILDVDHNQISGSIPSSIGNLVALTSLFAEGNNLQGPVPSSIGKLVNLQTMYLGANKLTNEIPLSFGNLTSLNRLTLQRNNFSGSIPQSLGNCTSLLLLDLSYNNLSGSIPPQILRLSSISIALDLSHNVLTGTIPSEVGTLRNLGVLDLSNNRLSGFIPTSLSSCVMMGTLYLGSNSLNGEIPGSLRALRGLEYLDLSQNNFSGKIPTFLVDFRLLYLNLSFNELQGEVPTLGVFQNQTAISVQGNPNLCGGIAILNIPPCSPPNSNKKLDLVKILIPTAGAICLALSLLCFGVIIYKRRTLQKTGTSPAATFMVPEPLRLSYADLMNATSGFSESNIVGAGSFGSVYKGTIVSDDNDEQTEVAVKVLNLNIRGAYKSLASECNALRGIRHRNLLKIMSVCDTIDFQGNDFKALVYEFMANGSLENWLHHNSEEEGRILSTIQRLDIAIDIASGVDYLHSGTDSTIIHGDLKPSNILLDQDMVAHVGDFGLAKIISSISPNLSSTEGISSIGIKGTIGYIPPEYGMNVVVSTQGDAYSYGILMLEMFTNIRPTSDAFGGYVNLQDFVSSALPERVKEVADPFLLQQIKEGDKYLDCIVSILKIGVRCSMQLPRDRMSMDEVVNEMKLIEAFYQTPRVQPDNHHGTQLTCEVFHIRLSAHKLTRNRVCAMEQKYPRKEMGERMVFLLYSFLFYG